METQKAKRPPPKKMWASEASSGHAARARSHRAAAAAHAAKGAFGKAEKHAARAARHEAKRRTTSFGAPRRCPNRRCMQGRELPHHQDRDADSTVCRVCGGAGTIPEAEYEAWMQDAAYVRDLAELPHSYSDFYADAFRRHRESEVLAGRMPTMTLAAFVASRRAAQGAPRIDPAFVRAAEPAREFRVGCLAGCFDGRTSHYHDQDTSYPCEMCAPYGGSGTIPAAIVAEWMRDEGYRAYCARTFSSSRSTYRAWADAQQRRRANAARGGEAGDAGGAAPFTAFRRMSLAAAARSAERAEAEGAERERERASAGPAWAELTRRARETTTQQQQRPAESSAAAAKRDRPSDADEHLCALCFDREQTHVFAPCGHFGFCGPCTATLHACPQCRAAGSAIRLWRVTFGARRARR